MYGSAKEGMEWILYLGGIIAFLGITLTTTCRSLVTKVPYYKNERKKNTYLLCLLYNQSYVYYN